MADGFNLVGESFSAALFPNNMSCATTTEGELLRQAKWRIGMTTSQTTSTGDPELDHELYEKTLQDQMYLPFGVKGRVPARRFGIWQFSAGSRKLRPIDDFSFNLHNATVETQERLDHGGPDEVAALAILIKRSIWLGKFALYDTNGDFREFEVHYSWLRSLKQLVGKTLT